MAGLVTVGWVVTVHAAKPVYSKISYPTDWSHRHVIFSHPQSPSNSFGSVKIRVISSKCIASQQALALPTGDFERAAKSSLESQQTGKLHRDWSQDMGTGASARAGNYPAKFSFDIIQANCGSATTPDYVVTAPVTPDPERKPTSSPSTTCTPVAPEPSPRFIGPITRAGRFSHPHYSPWMAHRSHS